MHPKQMSYDEIYAHHPEIYEGFHRIVDHTSNYKNFLESRNLVPENGCVFDVGAGFGELGRQLLKAHRELKYGYLEPSPFFFEKLEKAIQQEGNMSRVLERLNISIQELAPTQSYELVLAIHCWYYFQKDRAILDKVSSLVAKGGHLVISIVTRQNLTLKILDSLGLDFPRLYSSDLHHWLNEIQVAHQYVEWDHLIPLSSIISPPGEWTVDGKCFLQFHTRCAWDEIPNVWKTKAREILQELEISGQLPIANGALIISPE